MKSLISATAMLLSFSAFSTPAFAQTISETKLSLGEPKLEVTNLGDGKFATKLTLAPALVTSTGNQVITRPVANEITVSVQVGVWMQTGAQPQFHYLEESRPKYLTTIAEDTLVQSFVFSKNELMSQNSPICLGIVANTEFVSGKLQAPGVICAK